MATFYEHLAKTRPRGFVRADRAARAAVAARRDAARREEAARAERAERAAFDVLLVVRNTVNTC